MCRCVTLDRRHAPGDLGHPEPGQYRRRSLGSLRHACDASLLKHSKWCGPLDPRYVTLFHLSRDGVAPHVWNEHPATRDLDLIAPRWQCEERIAPPPFVRDSVDLNGHRKQSKQVTEWSMVGPNCQPGLRCRLSQDSLRSRGTLVDYPVINVGALPAGFAGYRCRSVTGAPVMPERVDTLPALWVSTGGQGEIHTIGIRRCSFDPPASRPPSFPSAAE
jgi:hypothetical protein